MTRDCDRVVTDCCSFRSILLEKKLEAEAEHLEQKEAELTEILARANLDPTLLGRVRRRGGEGGGRRRERRGRDGACCSCVWQTARHQGCRGMARGWPWLSGGCMGVVVFTSGPGQDGGHPGGQEPGRQGSPGTTYHLPPPIRWQAESGRHRYAGRQSGDSDPSYAVFNCRGS